MATRALGLAGVAVVAAAVGLQLWFRAEQRAWAPPPHLAHHPLLYREGLLSRQQQQEMFALAQRMARFPTINADLAFYNTTHEHIGEGVPAVNGRCDHPFLIPSRQRTHCVLPGRIDVGRHYIMRGGPEALKGSAAALSSRVMSFSRYLFNVSQYPEAASLFADEAFLAAARAVCPPDRQLLDPFQFNIIAQAPGQTVAMHIDAPYFWGASRFDVPQWLLAVMVFSGIYTERFVHQVQIVAYLHNWEDASGSRGGQFVYWDGTQPGAAYKAVPAAPRSGSAVDGSKTIHAAIAYRAASTPPAIDKSRETALVYLGDDRWAVMADEDVLRTYVTDDLRFSVVYRARCFADAEERARYSSDTQRLRMEEDILQPLVAELVRRGKLTRAEGDALLVDEPATRLQLAMRLMDSYIAYPPPAEGRV